MSTRPSVIRQTIVAPIILVVALLIMAALTWQFGSRAFNRTAVEMFINIMVAVGLYVAYDASRGPLPPLSSPPPTVSTTRRMSGAVALPQPLTKTFTRRHGTRQLSDRARGPGVVCRVRRQTVVLDGAEAAQL